MLIPSGSPITPESAPPRSTLDSGTGFWLTQTPTTRIRILAAFLMLGSSFTFYGTPVEGQEMQPVPLPEVLESHQAVIGNILIDNENIFDLDIPEENRYLYRAANKLHVRTRHKVILRQILFKPGDVFEQRLLEESERILRSNDYLKEAEIFPEHYADGVVDIHIRTTDVWTLDPRLSVGRSGGENSTTVGIRDSNLFGTGIYLGLFRKSNVDRDSTFLLVSDRELGNTHYGVTASYADNSDGKKAEFDFGKPFYALDARRSLGVTLLSEDRTDSLYDRGNVQASFRHQSDRYNLYAGVSKGLLDGWVNRYTMGLQLDEHRFGPDFNGAFPDSVIPENRKFIYPYLEWERLQDHYEETQKHDQIGITEDRYLGSRYLLRLGYASEGFGSLDTALILDGIVERGFGTSDTDSLLTSLDYHARVGSGGTRNSQMNLGAVYHHRQSDKWLLHMALTGSFGNQLDLDNPLILGGDNGLRGYPLRYQGGTSSALFTLEERIFTDWYPFRLVHIGAALFFDAGRTWGENPVGGENLGLLKDVGFGLRFGNSRSGIGRLVHLDFAFPLDGDSDISKLQVLLKGKATF